MLNINNLIEVEKSSTLLINEQSRAIEKLGRKVYKFGFGQTPFPVPNFVSEAHRQHAHEKFYSPVQGIEETREAVVAHHNKVNGFNFKAENCFIAPGSKILLFAIQAVFKEMQLYLPNPSWVSYAPQARLLGHEVHWVKTHYTNQWKLDPDALRAQLQKTQKLGKQALMVLNYPSNPHGMTYSKQQLEELTKVFREFNVLVVSDEIYGHLNHDGQHQSIAPLYPEGTIVTTGLSKWCGAGGWRFGTMMMSNELGSVLKEPILGIASETYSCAPTPLQFAALTAYKEDCSKIKGFVAKEQRILKHIGQFSAEQIRDAGVNVCTPEGGFYLYLDFSSKKDQLAKRGIHSSIELCQKLLQETGVVILEGSSFGATPDEITARLSYVDFDGGEALKNIFDDMTDFIPTYCPNVAEGIQKLADWIA